MFNKSNERKEFNKRTMLNMVGKYWAPFNDGRREPQEMPEM